MESVLVKKQQRVYRGGRLAVTIRYDDRCNNQHNTFAITGTLHDSVGRIEACGMIHEVIAEQMPHLQKYLKWHSCSSDGPLHYIANSMYHASDVYDEQYFVYLAGHTHKEVLLGLFDAAQLPAVLGEYGVECPPLPLKRTMDAKNRYMEPLVLEGQQRTLRVVGCPTYSCHTPDLEAARSCAIWPEAQLEDFTVEKLTARLPALMEEFRHDVEELGFVY